MKTRDRITHLRLPAALAICGASLLFAGCGDDADDTYVSDEQVDLDQPVAVQEPEQDPVQRIAPEGAEVQESAEIVLHEEQLNVEKETQPAGGIILRKEVVEVPASETVQLRSEEVEVVRLSPEEARERMEQGAQGEFSEEFTDEEVFIPLMEETARAETDVQTRGVVRAQTDVQTEERQIQETLRREELEARRITVEGEEEEYSARQQFDDQLISSEEMKQKVMDQLRDEAGLSEEQIDQLHVEVEENTVTIEGYVEDEQTETLIREALQNVEGIESVNLNL